MIMVMWLKHHRRITGGFNLPQSAKSGFLIDNPTYEDAPKSNKFFPSDQDIVKTKDVCTLKDDQDVDKTNDVNLDFHDDQDIDKTNLPMKDLSPNSVAQDDQDVDKTKDGFANLNFQDADKTKEFPPKQDDQENEHSEN